MKKNIAVIYGGFSGEYEISRQSAENIIRLLDKTKYEIFPVNITREKWVYESGTEEFPVDKNDFSLTLNGKKIRFDAVYNMIHGTPGEDGSIQGYLDMLGIPFTSSGKAAASLTANKYFCKGFARSLQIKVAKAVFVTGAGEGDLQKIKDSLSLPVFVKPNNGGSSVAMSKVKHWNALKDALETALSEDKEVLVEEFIEGREITCAAYSVRGKFELLPVTEIVSKKDFFDFEAKYDASLVDEIVPAPIPDKVWKECENTTALLYKELNCKGIVRMDYIFNDNGLYFLEVNTIPGMTAASIVPKMIAQAGKSVKEIVNALLEDCFAEK